MSVRNLCILLSSLSLSVFVSVALARVYIGQRHGLMRLWRHCRLLSRCRRCRWVGALLQRPIYKICTYVHMYQKVATWVEKSRIELSRVESSPVESSLTHFRIVLRLLSGAVPWHLIKRVSALAHPQNPKALSSSPSPSPSVIPIHSTAIMASACSNKLFVGINLFRLQLHLAASSYLWSYIWST